MCSSTCRIVSASGTAVITCLFAITGAAAPPAPFQDIEWILTALGAESVWDTVEERADAVFALERSEAFRENEAVRAALIQALDRANEEYLASIRDRDSTYSEGQGELLLALTRAVVELHHERAIAVLVRVAHTGLRVQRALARFGAPAVAQILDAWDARPVEDRTGSLAFRWSSLLDTLALMAAEDSLGANRQRVRAVAESVLAKPDNSYVLGSVMALAVSLQDSELLVHVEAIARDPGEAYRRGMENRRDIETIGRLAREYLSRLSR